ncbi:MAG TPA: SIS domain-containing protein [Vicinamibacterales bacterium]|nr:SIS domain-containing protein [Vicinamibacterales bacterium]
MAVAEAALKTFVADRLTARNLVSNALFDAEATRLARSCREMAARFMRGGRLLAFGHGASSTDAQHVSVEFVHPVIVGKRALPALDLSASFERWVPTLLSNDDMVMGFASPAGDPAVTETLAFAHAAGAQVFALPGEGSATTMLRDTDFAIMAPSSDQFVSQELIEILYHTLWETVHVFFEHGAQMSAPASGEDAGASAFLYPFLSGATTDPSALVDTVARSIQAKAADVARLREEVARTQANEIAAAIEAVEARIDAGGRLLIFGNGGSATDANDWAIDCAAPPADVREVPAISLVMEPATITALANDVGVDAIVLRQLIAHGRRGDVAIAISTSGGSSNVIAALEEARKRGMLTLALLGYDGGEIARAGLADLPIVVRSDYIPRIQEVQASIYHVMTEGWRSWNA